jgi:uncharacterized membrane protein/YHS domain-containing protein
VNELLAVFGRLHPLLLHLPIGLIAGLAALELIGLARRSPPPMGIVATLAMLTQLAAAMAVLTGLILVREGGYPEELATNHRNLGIAFLVVCIAMARLARREQYRTAFRFSLLVALGLVGATGHLGGSITHGDGFLFAPLEKREVAPPSAPNSTADAQTVVGVEPELPRFSYAEHIAPILEASCVECHGEKKRKGRLTMHTREGLERGGANGAVWIAGRPQESPMLARMRLPLDDEEHMPPADKPQPSAEQIALLEAWIAAGAPFEESFESTVAAPSNGTVSAPNSASVSEVASESAPTSKQPAAAPEKPSTPSAEAVEALTARLVHVQPISQDSSLLWIDFAAPAADIDDRAATELLAPLVEHVGELFLARTKVGDAALDTLARMPNLARLDLRATAITDAGVETLRGASALSELNLSQTAVSDASIDALASLPSLKRLYVWRTSISAEGRERLLAARPELKLEAGDDEPASALESESEVKFTSDAPLPGAEQIPTALAPVNTTCPVSGSPVNPKYAVVFDGKVVGFCCPNCPKEFWADPQAFADKLK